MGYRSMASRDRSVKASSHFATLLDRRALRRMAGSRSFERGEDYFVDRQVGAIAEHMGTITAKVQGTRPYQVKLWIDKEELEYSCTCPVGADGEFCKHCVAVGLTWLEGGQLKLSGKGNSPPAMTMDEVRAAHKPKRNFMKLLDQVRL